MRYNEKELQALSRQPAELAAELGMRGPKKGSVLKRRLVKLVVNFLFYFRTDEAEVGRRARENRPGGCSSAGFLEDPGGSTTLNAAVKEQCQEWMGLCVEPGGVWAYPEDDCKVHRGHGGAGGWSQGCGPLGPGLMLPIHPHRIPWSSSAYLRRPGSSWVA
uniref:Pleckstrin homology domain containing J1 n=1 Tax=Ursus americanus TaxID=9643 RepID=A0A452QAE0_URSAM